MNESENCNERATGLRSHSPLAIKQCCAAAYDSETAKALLGESFHPGGTELTEHLGRILSLTARSRVLDVAAGSGTSAIFLASRFGCDVVGIDYGRRNIAQAEREANGRGLGGKVVFQCGDAEQLPFPDGSFDAIICECALCTFPNKQTAVGEFARVLRVGGQLGLSDLTRQGALAPELDSLLSWVACVADAQPLTAYVALLSAANLKMRVTEEHNSALTAFVNQMRTRLLVTEVMIGLKKLALPGFDVEAAKIIAKHALAAISTGKLGYAIVTAVKAT
jgi:ubiquinone/menaquinone biosynthesis C-methylase UbiE